MNDMAEGIKPFRVDTVEEFNAEFGQAIKNVIGEGPVQEAIVKVVNSASTMFDSFSKSVNNFTKSVGDINLILESKLKGTEGAAEISVAEQAAATEVAQAAADNANQAAYHPRYNRGDFEPLAATNGGLVGPAVVMTANEQTLAGVQVSRPQNQPVESNAPTNGNPGEININLNGNLTMTLYGDKGKIGDVDLVKLLENNQNFQNDLARIIEKALEEQQKSGLSNNK